MRVSIFIILNSYQKPLIPISLPLVPNSRMKLNWAQMVYLIYNMLRVLKPALFYSYRFAWGNEWLGLQYWQRQCQRSSFGSEKSVWHCRSPYYGLEGISHCWFRSYLDNPKQKCSVNGSLFLIYINDLPNCLSISKPQMYADDTHLTFASNCVDTINEVLNCDLAKVNEWLIVNKLTLNASKTEFMLIRSRQRLSTFDKSPSLSIDDK